MKIRVGATCFLGKCSFCLDLKHKKVIELQSDNTSGGIVVRLCLRCAKKLSVNLPNVMTELRQLRN